MKKLEDEEIVARKRHYCILRQLPASQYLLPKLLLVTTPRKLSLCFRLLTKTTLPRTYLTCVRHVVA
jgi:hypothetical protein